MNFALYMKEYEELVWRYERREIDEAQFIEEYNELIGRL
jgi:hypothetical protein